MKKAVEATSREKARLIGREDWELKVVANAHVRPSSGSISLRAASSICSTSDAMLGGSYAASTFLGRLKSLRVMLMTSSSSAYSVSGLASLALVPQVRLDSVGDDDDIRDLI